jgi:hypothetical protein
VTVCYSAGARRTASHSVQRPKHCPLLLQESPCAPIKEGECQLPHWREKRGKWHTTRTLQELTYPAYPSLRNIAEVLGGKKLKTQLQGHKRLKL